MNHSMPAPEYLSLYTAAQVRELDRVAIEAGGISGATLMTRAGAAAWQLLQTAYPDARSLVVVCGTGNNGGDGYVVARLARQAGLQVLVLQLGDAGKIKGDALTARAVWLAAGGRVDAFDIRLLSGADVLVDALLGTGLERPLAGEWQAAVAALNAVACPVLAIDIPSGLHADTGALLGGAVKADRTLTFIGRKRGLYTGQGPEYAGQVSFDDLQVPAEVFSRVLSDIRLVTGIPLGKLARPRARTAHKGHHGHVLIIGGDHGMAGAVQLAGRAALRVGAGLVSFATRPEHAAAIAAACPELMGRGVATALDLKPLLARATIVVIGPGLGQSTWSLDLLSGALEASQPLVVDADALNLLAREPVKREDWVLTPHPAEAGRLLQAATAGIASDRFAAVRLLAERYGGVAVLKGAGTLVCTADQPLQLCAGGNPGMATAGMGDVLSGVIAGLAAQGLSLAQAAVAGVCVHNRAGDRAALQGERGMTAGDVIDELRPVMHMAGGAA